MPDIGRESHQRLAVWQQGVKGLREAIQSNPGATALGEAFSRFVKQNGITAEIIASPAFQRTLDQEGRDQRDYIRRKLETAAKEQAPAQKATAPREAEQTMVGDKTLDRVRQDALANDLFRLARLQRGTPLDSWSYPMRSRDEQTFRSTLQEIIRPGSDLNNLAKEEVGSGFILQAEEFLSRSQARAA